MGAERVGEDEASMSRGCGCAYFGCLGCLLGGERRDLPVAVARYRHSRREQSSNSSSSSSSSNSSNGSTDRSSTDSSSRPAKKIHAAHLARSVEETATVSVAESEP